MARRRKEGVSISLFPFLSILACVIGVLTLLITALALGQMDESGIARREQYQQIQDQIQIDMRELERLKKLIAEAEAIKDQLKEAQAELEKLKAEEEQAAKDNPLIGLIAESTRLKKQIEEVKKDIGVVDAEIKKLEAELKLRKNPPKEPQIMVMPSGTGRNITPFFVECRANSVVIHHGSKPVTVRRSELSRSKEFLLLMEAVKATPNGSIIFLIRPDAVGTYYTAHNIAQQNYCKNGKLPLVGFGKLDLSMFKDLVPGDKPK